MTADELRTLVNDATPGPGGIGTPQARSSLIALAPEIATLLADAMEYIEATGWPTDNEDVPLALLARFAALGETA